MQHVRPLAKANSPELQTPCVTALINEFPKVFGLGQRLVFGQWHLRAKQKIRKRPFVEQSVDHHRSVFDLEIEPVILGPEPVKHFAIAGDFAKAFAVEVIQIGLGHLERIEQIELLEDIQAGDFRSTDFIENDL